MQIYILLDRSGSMHPNWDETLGAMNAYARALKMKGRITLAMFDGGIGFSNSTLEFETLRRNVKIKKWTDLTRDEAEPRGVTPLYDAVGWLDNLIQEDNPEKATVVIITDGAENASTVFSKKDTRKINEGWQSKGYDVVFLGANFDAFKQAEDIGTQSAQTLNMTPGNYAATMTAAAARTVDYGNTGKVQEWSDKIRKRAVSPAGGGS